MYISELQVHNFGPIRKLHILLQPEGINLITGDNAAGKTQLLASLYAAFFDDEILQYHETAREEGLTLLQIHSDGKTFDLMRRYTGNSSQLMVNHFDDLALAAKINREHLFFYFPGLERTGYKKYTKSAIRKGILFLKDLGIQGHHILGTCQAKMETDFLMTIGEQRYLDLICFLSEIPPDSIVVADSILADFDRQMGGMVLEILTKIKGIQFILAEGTHQKDLLTHETIHHVPLLPPSDEISPVSYNYRMIPRNRQNAPESRDAAAEDTIIPISYCLGDVFPYGESRTVELKEIKGSRICDAIVANAEIYINAYLNSRPKEIGKIFWGVNDKKLITGVKLSYSDIDTIQKRISEALSHAEPLVSPDLYDIKFNPVASADGNVLPDVYIVEADVYPYLSNHLISTSRGEVYIKTPGGKQKLSNLQIQELVLLRASLSGDGMDKPGDF